MRATVSEYAGWWAAVGSWVYSEKIDSPFHYYYME